MVAGVGCGTTQPKRSAAHHFLHRHVGEVVENVFMAAADEQNRNKYENTKQYVARNII